MGDRSSDRTAVEFGVLPGGGLVAIHWSGVVYDRSLARTTISKPLAVLTGLVILLLIALTLFLVQQFDRAAKGREETVVAEGIQGRLREAAAVVGPIAVWDDAVRSLDHRLDPQWALDNLSIYFADASGFDGVFTVDRDDRPIFASRGKKQVAVEHFTDFQPVFGQLIGDVRRDELRRGPLPKTRPAGGLFAGRIQSTRIAMVDGQAFVVIATLVAPDFGRFRLLHDRAPIVIATLPIDDAFVATIANRYLLQSAKLRIGGARQQGGHAQVMLHDTAHRAAVTISWLPQRPGQALLERLGPPIALIGALLFIALVLTYRRTRSMAQGLVTSEIRATHMAMHDSLTGLPNRVLFLDRLQQGLAELNRYGGSLIVHCIDLDRFKEINDTLGHPVGDELLKAAAERMAAQCRGSDTFARLSGDEFAIVQRTSEDSDAASLASRICAVMAEPFALGEGRVFSGCSIGTAQAEKGMTDPVELLRQADLALYRAKTEERGSFCLFEPTMDAAVKTRRALEADLRDALATDALKLFYQPQVDGRGVIIGAEALVRWTHPTRGEVSPGLFVPVAEQSGLIIALGLFTLRRAFEDSRRWPGLRISVNISANQLRSGSFVEDLRSLVESCDVDPSQFELEITEGVLLGDDPAMLRKLLALRHMGFSLVLDDFGTGYSSLSYLRKFPIDKIKIDRSFIANLGLDGEPEELVLAIVRLARALKLGVIAEGVETLSQWSWLCSIGCPDSQGFFFRPALPGNEIDGLWTLRERSLWGANDDALPQQRGLVAVL